MRILIGTSNKSVGGFLKRALTADGYRVEVAEELRGVLHAVENGICEFLIIDTCLLGPEGCDALRRVRDVDKELPILALTEGDRIQSRVLALDAGADDCMSMPLAYRELAARIRAISRRNRVRSLAELAVGDLVVDVLQGVVRRGTTVIKLTRRELLILEQLIRARGRPVSRKELIDGAFEGKADGSNAVDVYVYYLRRKIDQGGEGGLIRSVRGVGYRIEVPQ